MQKDRKIRLINKGETDLYIFSLLKELEEKIDILERRICLIEDNIIERNNHDCPYHK